MARRRMIDPNIWASEDFAGLPVLARLVFIGLFSQADDEGRGQANASYLRSILFPFDNGIRMIDVEKTLSEIGSKMSVTFYDHNGKKYYQLDNWDRWQTICRPNPSKFPPPPGWKNREINAETPFSDDSETIHGALNDDSMNIHGALNDDSHLKEVKRKEEKRREEKRREENKKPAREARPVGFENSQNPNLQNGRPAQTAGNGDKIDGNAQNTRLDGVGGTQLPLTPRIAPKTHGNAPKRGDGSEPFTPPAHLADIWPDFVEMRIKTRKPMTEAAKRGIVAKLEKLEPGDFEAQREILQESINNSYQGVFPLKKTGGGYGGAGAGRYGNYSTGANGGINSAERQKTFL